MVYVEPYLPIVTFSKNGYASAIASGFDPNNADFNLIEARMTLSQDGQSGIATILIEDSDRLLFDFFAPGGTVILQMGKESGVKSNIMTGFVEIRKATRPAKDILTYTLTCYDKSIVLNRRAVNVHLFRNRDSSGTLVSDPKMDPGNIVKYVIGLKEDGVTPITDAYYPMNKLASTLTLAQEHAITVANVGIAGWQLDEYNADFAMANDVIKDIAEGSGKTYNVDYAGDLHFTSADLTNSGFLITDDPNAAWGETDKILYVIDDNPLEFLQTLEDTRNMLIGIGGNSDLEQYYQKNTSGGYDTLYDKAIAFKLTGDGPGGAIKDSRIAQLAIWVDKVGNPNDDLRGVLKQDDGGLPYGASVKEFRIGRGAVPLSTDSNKWAITDLVADINTSKDHWIILYQTSGGDASNHYRWYHDGGSAGTYSTSTDGAITWAPATSGSKSYSYMIWPDERIVSLLPDNTSIQKYGQRDEIISDSNILSTATMQTKLAALIKQLRNMKQVYAATCFPSDSVPPIGKVATVRDTFLGITNEKYKLIQADYVMQGIGALDLDIVASKVWT